MIDCWIENRKLEIRKSLAKWSFRSDINTWTMFWTSLSTEYLYARNRFLFLISLSESESFFWLVWTRLSIVFQLCKIQMNDYWIILFSLLSAQTFRVAKHLKLPFISLAYYLLLLQISPTFSLLGSSNHVCAFKCKQVIITPCAVVHHSSEPVRWSKQSDHVFGAECSEVEQCAQAFRIER